MKKQRKEEVLKEIKELFKKAKLDKSKADYYIKKARKLGMKNQTPIPKDLKKKFCKHCYTYFIPGKNYRVRTKNTKVIYYCLNCKKYTRYPFLKERKARRSSST